LNIHGVKDVGQTEIHTAQPLMFQPRALEVEMATEKLKRQKSPSIDQIPAELIKVEGTKICYTSINILILCGIRRNCLTSVRSPSFYLSIRRVIKQILVITEKYRFC
jgi:hypothetical protein